MSCIIPGCSNVAHNVFGVRLRRPDTTAIWAPNTEATLCDIHAVRGLSITVIFEPTNDAQIETKICGFAGPTADRITAITNPA